MKGGPARLSTASSNHVVVIKSKRADDRLTDPYTVDAMVALISIKDNGGNDETKRNLELGGSWFSTGCLDGIPPKSDDENWSLGRIIFFVDLDSYFSV